jgi:diacylglycerol O-acyltransferase
MDRLNPIDAQFIDAEDRDRNTSMAIASIAVFEGPPPSYDEFVAEIARRLPLVPLYRKKLRTVALCLGPPLTTRAITSGRPRCQRPAGTSSSGS